MRLEPELKLRKSKSRAAMRQQLEALDPAFLAAAALAAHEKLLRQAVWQESRGVLLYSAVQWELTLGNLPQEAMSQGKVVSFLRFNSTTHQYSPARILNPRLDLVPGKYGIIEPAQGCPDCPWNELDAVLVPGVAFAADGKRLGRGKGYYDRVLGFFVGKVIGVCLDCQVLPELPAEAHDRCVDFILTPTRWIDCKPRADLE